jgi:hypothetical protein
LHCLSGDVTKKCVREQMQAMRDHGGFGGVAPLTFRVMYAPTQSAYLPEVVGQESLTLRDAIGP